MENVKAKVEKKMLAYCGLYCGLCSFKVAHDERDDRHLDAVPYPFTRHDLTAYNCENCKGFCICGPCKIKDCASAKDIDSCADCADFPCSLSSAFANDGMPHHKSAVENLHTIHIYGFEYWAEHMNPALTCHCGERQSWYYICPQHEQ